ncbi:MAG: hypothetical protein OZSIB_1521 [Candidatus Ozemobacter sibiricus]|uniref:Uncharacterized protein n=1 Tax=Candidatus Ozemobacter sibiricus TaxID=2268124 RepID=A0A367ZKW9_9BACT|nr:MAG: hypothetical protein OZSIB_1521 [Candidatus Ozemobacter sibiricus]
MSQPDQQHPQRRHRQQAAGQGGPPPPEQPGVGLDQESAGACRRGAGRRGPAPRRAKACGGGRIRASHQRRFRTSRWRRARHRPPGHGAVDRKMASRPGRIAVGMSTRRIDSHHRLILPFFPLAGARPGKARPMVCRPTSGDQPWDAPRQRTSRP